MNSTKTLLLVLTLGVFSHSALSDEQKSTSKRKNEICVSQIEEYVKSHFHQTVVRIDFDLVFDNKSAGPQGDSPTSMALAYMKECPGYHVFELFATDFDCDGRAYLGEVPGFLRYRTSGLGC